MLGNAWCGGSNTLLWRMTVKTAQKGEMAYVGRLSAVICAECPQNVDANAHFARMYFVKRAKRNFVGTKRRPVHWMHMNNKSEELLSSKVLLGGACHENHAYFEQSNNKNQTVECAE